MREPEVPSPLAVPRRSLVACIGAVALVTVAVSIHSRALSGTWTNALSMLLGGLAGTFIGEQLERFGERIVATRIVWLQMAVIAFLVVGAISWQALPAYCQVPVTFAMGAVIVATVVYIQRLRMRLP
jgi:hypothetical protein